ncbi:polymorphic toxin-type HINT domain-containing protein, partial [Amycolatopsis sp. NPDC059020]
AYASATAATTDAGKASRARQDAEAADAAASSAKDAAAAARLAGQSADSAKAAASAAGSAGNHAADAARAAADAANNAASSGANAAEARRAAAAARANADRANRAANAASAFAAVASDAAYASAAAADRAASDAQAAAAAARDAAEHAGQAADAARQATEHANAATAAAQAAIDAANQAKKVYEAARQADATRLATEAEQNDELARGLAAAAGQVRIVDKWNKTQDALRTAETNRLISEATAAGTDPGLAVTDARKVALALSATGGPWTQAAANAALSEPDIMVMDYIRTGMAAAAAQDDRLTLSNLVKTGTDGFKKAANAALAGTDADVQTFLRTQDYPERQTDDRIAVNQVLASAQQAGNTITRDAAQQALNDGSAQALRQFLTTDQYSTADHDERIKANQILSAEASGPELKAAAQVALDGTQGMLHDFLVTGQFAAAQRDMDTATHNAEVLGLLAQAAQSAQQASHDANEAQAAAATARGAADAATGYARQAETDATQAGIYAKQAHESAIEAQNSAQKAAQSAATARTAAASAEQSAGQAARSAVWAASSANLAAGYARDAYNSAHDAFIAAKNAGDDARKAADAAHHALGVAQERIEQDRKLQYGQLVLHCEAVYKNKGQTLYQDCLEFAKKPDAEKMMAYLDRSHICDHIAKSNGNFNRQCYAGILSPTFEADLAFQISGDVLNGLAGLDRQIAIYGAGLAAALACAAFEPCGVLAASIIPEGTAFTSWMAITVGDIWVTSRAAAAMEESFVEQQATRSNLANEAAKAFTWCAPNSFTGKTRVLLHDGTSRPLEDVQVGDRVAAADPVTRRTGVQPVTQVITGNGVKRLVDVQLSSAGQVSTIQATENHPFWVEELKQWVKAGSLQSGEHLHSASGTPTVVTSIRRHAESLRVYNLTVGDLHTYYVTTGEASALVHNSSPACGLGGFKIGILGDELNSINRSFGGEFLLNGSPENMMINASRYNSFWEKAAVIVRDIAGGHMYNNGNKRTAQTVVEILMARNGVISGPTSMDLRSVIDKVGKGELREVGDIAAALRGY